MYQVRHWLWILLYIRLSIFCWSETHILKEIMLKTPIGTQIRKHKEWYKKILEFSVFLKIIFESILLKVYVMKNDKLCFDCVVMHTLICDLLHVLCCTFTEHCVSCIFSLWGLKNKYLNLNFNLENVALTFSRQNRTTPAQETDNLVLSYFYGTLGTCGMALAEVGI